MYVIDFQKESILVKQRLYKKNKFNQVKCSHVVYVHKATLLQLRVEPFQPK
jgi:hypothetical protein